MSGTFQVCCSERAAMHHSALTGHVENKPAASLQLEDSSTLSTSRTFKTTPSPQF